MEDEHTRDEVREMATDIMATFTTKLTHPIQFVWLAWFARPSLQCASLRSAQKVEPPSPTFFVTQRPETPQQKFSLDLGPGEVFGLSDDDESVGNDSVWTKTDETVESAMARINERAEQVEDMVNREESLMVYERVKQIKMKREGVKHLEGRKTLIARYQKEEVSERSERAF